MRIFDETANKSISNITILLKKNEITQLIGYLEELSLNTTQNEHYHLTDDAYSKEITIALYDENGCLDKFADKYKKLILSNEL